MKSCSFRIKIDEGNDEFWESLQGKTGCDELTDIIKEAMAHFGFDSAAIKLVKFTDEESRV